MVASALVFLERLLGKPRNSSKGEAWDQDKKVSSFCCPHKEHSILFLGLKSCSFFRKGDFGLMALVDKAVSCRASFFLTPASQMYVPGKLHDVEHVLIDVGTGYYVEKVRR